MFIQLREKLAEAIAEAAGVPVTEAERSIELPKGQFGDVASSICFALAKKEKKNPVELARNIAGKIQLPNWVAYVKVEGPYLNFLLSDAFYAELVAKVAEQKGEFGKAHKKRGKTIVEFPSVNPNKPWHIGHLRNALLGDAVARIIEYTGETVERTDYIDDLGLQVAQSFWGFLHLGKKPTGKLDLWLGQEYVEVSKRFEKDEKIQGEVRALLKQMEEGDNKSARDCRKLVEDCVVAQYETAFKFKVYHDVLIFESDILKTIFQEGMELLKSSNAIMKETGGKNAGCWVAKMTSPEFANMESPDKILIRSDGTATYTGKDVIFQLWKFGLLKNDFKYEKCTVQPNDKTLHMSSHHATGGKGKFGKATRVLNVIGMEQAYPQKVIKEILLSMGYKKEAEHSVHLSYEHVWLEDEKFSGRQGTWIGFTADELYAEGFKRAEGKIKPEVGGAERGKIATSIAAGAIRFAFLRTTPEKKIIFSWDTALSLEGDSAHYIIYAHARAHKIL
ncbi:MAG: arginine--tRNA ligase [Candidatus Micrarchaeota archaeon]|nr:arginine--tRNA ligase [Candidatus Micrarchaeota archaeon]